MMTMTPRHPEVAQEMRDLIAAMRRTIAVARFFNSAIIDMRRAIAAPHVPPHPCSVDPRHKV